MPHSLNTNNTLRILSRGQDGLQLCIPPKMWGHAVYTFSHAAAHSWGKGEAKVSRRMLLHGQNGSNMCFDMQVLHGETACSVSSWALSCKKGRQALYMGKTSLCDLYVSSHTLCKPETCFCVEVFEATFKDLRAKGMKPDVLHPACSVPQEQALSEARSSWREVLPQDLVSFLGGSAVFLSINRFERKKARPSNLWPYARYPVKSNIASGTETHLALFLAPTRLK